MMPPQLTAAQWPTYRAAFNRHALQRVDFHLMTLDHTHIASIQPLALAGTVHFNTDGDATVARVMQAEFLDPDHTLMIDTSAPSDGMGGMNRLIQVRHSLWVEEFDEFVTCPMFTGQPMVPKRNGETITLDCHDKSARHLRYSPPYTIPKGQPVVTAIRAGLRRAGEHHFDFPSPTGALARARTIRKIPVGGKLEARQPWRVYQRLARQIGYQLFYDGAGVAVLRPKPKGTTAVTWRVAGAGANIIGPIGTEADHTTMRNRTVVTSKRSVRGRSVSRSASAQLPVTNVYSPRKLAAGGEDWHNTDYSENNDLITQRQVNAAADTRLDDLTTQTVTIALPVMPVPFLDPLDIGRVETDDAVFAFPIREASVPLFDDGSTGMTVGQQKPVPFITSRRVGAVA